jgi:hypothetical protein
MPQIYSDMNTFVRDIRQRIRNKFDSIILHTGENGEGKTTDTIQLAKRISFENFKIDKNYVKLSPTFNDLLEFIEKKPFYSTLALDEAIDLIYKMYWNTSEQKKVNQLMVKCRKDFKCLIFCIPRLTDANEYFRNDRIMFHLYTPKRGKTFIFRKNSTLFNKDAFCVAENEKILKRELRGKTMHEVPLEDYYRALRKLKGYIGEFSFEPLSPEEEQAYDEVAALSRYDSFNSDKRSDVQKAVEKAIDWLLTLGMSQSEISRKLEYSKQRVNAIIKSMKLRGELTWTGKKSKSNPAK